MDILTENNGVEHASDPQPATKEPWFNMLDDDDEDVDMDENATRNRFLDSKDDKDAGISQEDASMKVPEVAETLAETVTKPAPATIPDPQPIPRQKPLNTIRMAPVQATTTSGVSLSFGRKKKVEGLRDTRDLEPRSGYLERPVHKLITEIDSTPSTSSQPPAYSNYSHDSRLWTDKYKPSKFTDLMGDDRLNRQVMSWLKEWDKCVFNKNTADSQYKRKRDAEPYAYRDPYNLGRPQERVLLVSGPPGLGKTTLAYVIAKHAGYRVFEVNASDDRTARTVDDKLKSALDVNPITLDGKVDKRPTLVLVDEVDGATGEGSGGFVRQLINIASDYVPKKRKNGTTEPRLLLRPIICICNDLYAPSLRSLRPLARIVRYKPPSTLATVTRLKDICNEEDMPSDTKSLNMLAESSGGDIRNCLNTLQVSGI